MIGVKAGVKNDLGYSFGLNGIDWKMARPGRLELPTLCLEDMVSHYIPCLTTFNKYIYS